ncbi:MAG: hypothetical protein NTV51_15775 [Verrucomicrobia bacterium]|nr:hypothetical protein [Verrucomicrobiota bacterium]
MSLRWLLFFTAALTLLAPLPAFYSRKRRFRSLQELEIERRNGSRWEMMKQILRFSGHWIELLRGLGASLALLALMDELRPVSELYEAHASWARFVLPLAAAIVSVILTGILFHYPGKAIAPVAFVSATLLVLVPPQVSVPAVLLAGFCALKLRSLPLFFIILTPVLVVLGLLLDRQIWPSVAGAVLAIAPLAHAFGRHRDLVIPVRRPNSGG